MVPSRHFALVVAMSTLLLGLAKEVEAQGRSFIGGALSVGPWQPGPVSSGTPSSTFDNSSTEAVQASLGFEAGRLLTSSTALGVEAAFSLGRSSVTQRTFYFSPAIRQISYRENRLLTIVRQRLKDGAYAVDVVGGLGFAFADAHSRSAEGRFGAQSLGPYGPETASSRTMFSFVAGVDAAWPVAQRGAIVPHLRIQWADRGEPTDVDAFGNLGLPNPTYQAGVGVRVGF